MDGGAWQATVYGVAKSWTRSETEHLCMNRAEGGTGNRREVAFKSPSLREGNGNPLQNSCLENPMDGGAWWATVQGAANSQSRRSDLTN